MGNRRSIQAGASRLCSLPATRKVRVRYNLNPSPPWPICIGISLCIQLVGLFEEVDDDHDGYLHYTEFLAATLETDGKEVTDERLAEAFDQLDMDDSGVISTENLEEFLGKDSKVRPPAFILAQKVGACQAGILLISAQCSKSHRGIHRR